MRKIKETIMSMTKVGKLKLRINTLENENEYEYLKSTIKDELYKTFMDKLQEPAEIVRLRNDNKNLRKKVKILKEMLKEDKKIGGGKKK